MLANTAVGPVVEATQLNAQNWPAFFSVSLRAAWMHALPLGSLQLFAEGNNVLNEANACCSDYQLQGGQLQSNRFGWQPRFILLGARWQLP
jgi:hypothetical protein